MQNVCCDFFFFFWINTHLLLYENMWLGCNIKNVNIYSRYFEDFPMQQLIFGMVVMPLLCRGVWFSPKLSYHQNVSLAIYLPIFLWTANIVCLQVRIWFQVNSFHSKTWNVFLFRTFGCIIPSTIKMSLIFCTFNTFLVYQNIRPLSLMFWYLNVSSISIYVHVEINHF